jgi:hypothetical protein
MREPTVRGRRTGLKVCPTDFDPDHPQNFLPEAVHVLPDPEALRDARPDTGREASRQMYPNNNWLTPPYPPSASVERRSSFRPGGEGAVGGTP